MLGGAECHFLTGDSSLPPAHRGPAPGTLTHVLDTRLWLEAPGEPCLLGRARLRWAGQSMPTPGLQPGPLSRLLSSPARWSRAVPTSPVSPRPQCSDTEKPMDRDPGPGKLKEWQLCRLKVAPCALSSLPRWLCPLSVQASSVTTDHRTQVEGRHTSSGSCKLAVCSHGGGTPAPGTVML